MNNKLFIKLITHTYIYASDAETISLYFKTSLKIF